MNTKAKKSTNIVVHKSSYLNDTITTLQENALELAGLTYDRAFAIDTINIGIDTGEYTLTKLMEAFFELVYKDPDEWFRSKLINT